MKESNKALIALVVFNCILACALCLILGGVYYQYHQNKLRTINSVNLKTFRDSAPLPANITGAKVLVIASNGSKSKPVAKKVTKKSMRKTEIDLANKISKTFLGTHQITFYSTETCKPGKPCHTATGTTPKHMWTAAVDPRVIPLGTKIFVEGFGILRAEDTGGAIKGNRVDIYVANYDQAIKLGRQTRKVYAVKDMKGML